MRKKVLNEMDNKKIAARVSLAMLMGLCCMCSDSLGSVRVYADVWPSSQLPAISEEVPVVAQSIPQASERPFSSSMPSLSPEPSFFCTLHPGVESSEIPAATDNVPIPSAKPIDPIITRRPPRETISPATRPPAVSIKPPATYIPPLDTGAPESSAAPSDKPIYVPPTIQPSAGSSINPGQPAEPDQMLGSAKPSGNSPAGIHQSWPGGLLLPGLFHGEVGSYNSSGKKEEEQVLMPGFLSVLFDSESKTRFREAEKVRGDIRHIDVKQVTRSKAEQTVKPLETGDHTDAGPNILLMMGSICLISATVWNKHRKKEEEPL